MKIIISLLCLLPLLISCQDYNKPPFDEKEKILRKFPIEETKTMVLDSLWNKRDSLTYLRLKNLEVITMNEVTYIPSWISNFKEVEIFQIINEKNKIKSIPRSISNLAKLRQFDIPNNEINSIPESFYDLKNLKNLNFENNKIQILSSRIGNLDSLQSLDISENPLKYLPSKICKLKKMKFLDLDNTKIRELPKCLENLRNLEWIHASGTQITEIPVEVLNNPSLQSVQAKGLKLKNYKEIKAICEKKNIRFHYDE